MEHQPGSRHWQRIAVGLGVAVLVAACSGTGTATPSAAAPSEAAPTSAAPSDAAPSDASPSDASPSAATGAALADTCAKAVTEGKLVQWHNHSDNYVKVMDAFKAAYPGIATEELILSPDEAAQRVLTEVAASRPPTPDLVAGGLDVLKPLIDRGVVDTSPDWAALGVPADYIHPSDLVRVQRVAIGLGYNTDSTKAEDLPNTWEELIDAKWAGQVIVDPRGRPFDSLGLEWGKEKTIDYVNRLKATDQPLVIEGGTAGLVAVAGGEAAITTGGRSAETLEQQAEGAPIDIKYLDVIPTLDNYHVPLVGSAHPNAAACFIGWMASEGQDLFNQVEFKSNDAIPPQAPAGAKVLTIESPEQADQVKELSTEIGRIWTGG
jgi:iron(III) transport system substrate-binding protein